MIRRSGRPRRNPGAESFVALVKRYVHGDAEPSRWAPLSVGADGLVLFDTEAEAVAFASVPHGAVDLAVGDLVVVIPLEYAGELAVADGARWLGVVTPGGVRPAPRPPRELKGSWLSEWGRRADATLDAALNVAAYRLVMAACDCAETVVHQAPAYEDDLREAIATVRARCRGDADREDVFRAEQHMRDLWYLARRDIDCGARHSPARHAATIAEEVVSAVGHAVDALGEQERGQESHSSARTAAMSVARVGRLLGHGGDAAYESLGPLVDRWIPLPVALLAQITPLGEPEAIPFDPSMVPVGPRENPHRAWCRRNR